MLQAIPEWEYRPKRTTKQEVTSEEECQVTKTEIGRAAGRKTGVPDKPEEDLWTETEERGTPGIKGGTQIGDTEGRETANKDRQRPETEKQLRADPKIPIETPSSSEESCHVPGGAWHTQVRS
ncbi:hypothetical protein NDU88_006546 [Pleurodeles waltl]|uniref:Uncharacterized protein n=1 Tax=Pleurodeles waltl TaxID=8319 RepID=A0AAV7SPZ6_PLEWA|nr:hypothetical protein NDU88_006546 [Pleurodeles waltl]